ncbi:MAG: SRPBCC domain-containing protein [Chlorobi bacterium]|nr:SRPBCC domain-containing protein [Chlorobiota bacterium]
MAHIFTEITIPGPPADVWHVLADTAAWPGWNPLVTAVKGVPEKGGVIRIRLKVRMLPALWVPVRVETLSPPERLCWNFTLPFGFFRAEHCFSLAPGPGGSTRFSNTERFTGLLGGAAGTIMNRFFREDYAGMDRALAGRVAAR